MSTSFDDHAPDADALDHATDAKGRLKARGVKAGRRLFARTHPDPSTDEPAGLSAGRDLYQRMHPTKEDHQ